MKLSLKAVLLLCVILFAVISCESGKGLGYKPDPDDVIVATPVKDAGIYLDFEDIQIPSGLKILRKKSYVYETETIKTGVLIFQTKLKRGEIEAYFKENMAKDNWVLTSSFKFHRSILLYSKPNKNCVILIEKDADTITKTLVEIWVSPQNMSSSGDKGTSDKMEN